MLGLVKVVSETSVYVNTNPDANWQIDSDKSLSYHHDNTSISVDRDGKLSISNSNVSLELGSSYEINAQINPSVAVSRLSNDVLTAQVEFEGTLELLNEPSIDGYVPVSRTTTTVKDNYDVVTIKNVTETRMREEIRDGVVYGLSGAILYGIGVDLTEIISNPYRPSYEPF